MISEKIKRNVIKIEALFDYYEGLANRTLHNRSELSATKEKMYFTRKHIIELTAEINKLVKVFEERL